MAVTEHSTGTQTTVITTDHLLGTVTGAVSVLIVDLEPLAVGDVLEIFAKTQAVAAGTMRQPYASEVFRDDVAGQHFVSIPIGNSHDVQWHIKQTAGAPRNLDWSIQILG